MCSEMSPGTGIRICFQRKEDSFPFQRPGRILCGPEDTWTPLQSLCPNQTLGTEVSQRVNPVSEKKSWAGDSVKLTVIYNKGIVPEAVWGSGRSLN